MSPRTKQQFADIREEKRSLIMNTALELFAEDGFHNASVSKIAIKAGISKGLLYNYFESKEELLKAIILEGLNRIGDWLDPNKDGIITKEEMRSFIEHSFDMMSSDTHFWTLYYSLMVQSSVQLLVSDKLEKTFNKYIGMLTKYFEMLGHSDPYTDALIFGSLMDGIGINFVANPAHFPTEKIKLRLIELYCS